MKKITYFLLLSVLISSCCKDTPNPEPQEQNRITYNGVDYETVVIGNQEWFKQNLKTESFNNGDPIDFINHTDEEQWSNTEHPTYTKINCDSISWEIGYHYNYYVVVDERNVCPSGWRVPNRHDMEILIQNAGGNYSSSYSLHTDYGWQENPPGINSFEFNAYPNFMVWGSGSSNGTPCDFPNQEQINMTLWAKNNINDNQYFYMSSWNNSLTRVDSRGYDSFNTIWNFNTGMGIRCIKE